MSEQRRRAVSQSGQMGLGTDKPIQAPTILAGDIRLLFKGESFPSKQKDNTFICLPGTLKDTFGEGRAKRKKRRAVKPRDQCDRTWVQKHPL